MDLLAFDLSFYIYVIIAITAFFATLTQAILGMGYAIIFMAIVPYFFDYNLALAMMFILYIIVIGLSLFSVRKYMNFQLAWPCIIGNTSGLIVGFGLLTIMKSDLIIKILGGFFILLSVYLFKFADKVKIIPTKIKG